MFVETASPSRTLATSRSSTVRPLTDRSGNVKKGFDRFRTGVDFDRQLALTFTQRAGGQSQILLADDGADLGGRQVEGVQGVRVKVDHDLPGRAAVR